MMSPTSPASPPFKPFPTGKGSGGSGGEEEEGGGEATAESLSKRNSINSTFQERTEQSKNNNMNKADPSLPPLSSIVSPVSPSSSFAAALPPVPLQTTPVSTAWSTPAPAIASVNGIGNGGVVVETETPKLQKRRSFAQSLKHGMLSLTQLLSPSSSTASSRVPSPMTTHSYATKAIISRSGPPHYNILVLGSDSAPLASTLYKMSSLLPSTTKIRHYQEISGFFVAYFRSNGSFSCSPTMTPTTPTVPATALASIVASASAPILIERDGVEVKNRRGSLQDSGEDDPEETKTLRQSSEDYESVEDQIMTLVSGRPSEKTLLQSKISSSGGDGTSCTSGDSTSHSVIDLEREEILLSENDGEALNNRSTESITSKDDASVKTNIAESELEPETFNNENHNPSKDTMNDNSNALNASANASLSVHAFSLDTTWPVPRILAQTFWFPYAHGIIYIVDATRKNDPRGIDHLLNARQFLASLVADPHFSRKDIPVVVFANKAGLNPETCYRVDEIAEILGCEDWDLTDKTSSPIESENKRKPSSGDAGVTRKTGAVEGGVDASSGAFKARPWCVKSTRCDGAGDGLRESVEWLKSRMGETWETGRQE
ncbi:hypothetical protein FBU30_002501 [Linnemannia zychae]|nr:hypothetical protein FBU30_002501 [Linnemannia zychae]